MKRLRNFSFGTLGWMAFIIPGFGVDHGHQAKGEITTAHVAGTVYMLQGQGGNIAICSGEDGLLMVDDQFQHMVPEIRRSIEEIKGGALRFVINTHWHGDHTGANEVFGKEATIVAHENVRKLLMTGGKNRFGVVEPLAKEGWPIITFQESLSIHLNGEEITVVHFPHGHTNGDSVIFFSKSNVVHMGDHFFAERFPFIDLDNGGSVEGLIENVASLIKKISPQAKIIPGHGKLSTLEDLKNYQQMLVSTTEIVRSRIEEKKSLEQAVQEGLSAQWDTWGQGFVKTPQWIELIYQSLSKKSDE